MVQERRGPIPKARTASKEFRRQQLVDSTIESIAKRGFAETTLANVADGAGLSRGIVNLHFQSKEALLIATLQYLADEYRDRWSRALAAAGPGAADKVRALVAVDLDPAICNRKKIAVWYAFWGESKSRPTYRRLCEQRDQEYVDVLCDLCRDIAEDGGYDDLDPVLIAKGISALTDGLWLDLLVTPKQFDRESAKQICLTYLAGVFPRHFTAARQAAQSAA